jgi:hypothetical protein
MEGVGTKQAMSTHCSHPFRGPGVVPFASGSEGRRPVATAPAVAEVSACRAARAHLEMTAVLSEPSPKPKLCVAFSRARRA